MTALYKTALVALTLLFSAPAAHAFDLCLVGLVKDGDTAAPLSYMRDATGPAMMSCKEAASVAAPLNQRHNNTRNGLEPVVATVYEVMGATSTTLRVRPLK